MAILALEIGQSNHAPFTLPADTATQKLAFLARSGAGKTYAATKVAELLVQTGIPIVALDPVGVWYGLRLAADGQGSGLPIPVFGGEYGDIPLEPHAGALVADLIVDRNLSVILDVSGFRKQQRKEFVTAFAEQLFHRKKTQRSPLHLFLEEAQTFVPQRVMKGDERMLGAFEDIGKIGRNYGIGLTLISQRPQSVHKDVLNQVECLFVLQLNGAQERKAIRDWISAQGIDAGGAVDELPQLAIGEALVWSPQWLPFFGRVTIGTKTTYNASATPTIASAPIPPRPLDPQALYELHQAMQRTLEVPPAQPHLPRARAAAPAAIPVTPPVDGQVIGQALLQLQQVATQLAHIIDQLTTAYSKFRPTPGTLPIPAPPAPLTPHGTQGISVPQQRILDALASFAALGVATVAKHHVAIWSKQSPRSSAYGNHLGALRSAGLIAYPGTGMVALTTQGQAHAQVRSPITSLIQLHQAWYDRLPAPQGRILRVLITAYPQPIDRTALARAATQSPTSSAYGNHLGALRTLGLIAYPERGLVVATSLLFPSPMPT